MHLANSVLKVVIQAGPEQDKNPRPHHAVCDCASGVLNDKLF
jgi:hypothetical protein